jgi:acylpyruvate hydrolase
MKLATIRQGETTSAGRVEGDEIVLLPFADVGELLASGAGWNESARADGPRVSLAEAQMSLLVPRPWKIICVGRNYMEHIQEGRSAVPRPTFPELFTKFPESLAGPYDDIRIPAGATTDDWQAANAAAAEVPTAAQPNESDYVDWEAELVVVIGKAVRRADEAAAAEAIAGFSVGNDVSVRDWQLRTSQWMQGKAWEAMSPVGPVLLTTDEVGARPDLQFRCLVDGTVMQDGRTGDMVFDPVDLVSYISRFVTMRPGDLIFTGTTAGVGMVRTPPVYLRPGQVMITEVEGIGQTVNRLVADDVSMSASLRPTAEQTA